MPGDPSVHSRFLITSLCFGTKAKKKKTKEYKISGSMCPSGQTPLKMTTYRVSLSWIVSAFMQ